MDKIWLYCWPLLWLWEIFLKIFFMWTIFKVFTEFVTILLLFYILVFWPQGMWDLSSLTRDWTSCMKGEVLNRWIFRQVPGEIVLFPSWNFILLIHSIEFIINISWETSVQFSSVAQLCPTLCDPMNRSRLGIPVHHQLLKFTQTHVHWVSDAIQPSHSLSSPFLLPPIPPSTRVFSNESTLCMRWPKYWSFSFSISPSNEHPGLICFRMDWLDLLAVQGTLKSLLQHHS